MMQNNKTQPLYIITILSSVLLWFILFSPALAAGPEKIRLDASAPQKVTLTVGKSIIVESPAAFKKFALAAPDYADVTVLSPRQIYLIGKVPGATNATIWGVDGRILAMLDIEIMPDVSRLKEKIHEMLPNEKDIKVTASHDAIVLAGTVSTTSNLSQVVALANAYAPQDKDKKSKVMNLLEVGGVHQVMLEVRVSEMSRTLMRRLGVNWAYVSEGGQTFGVTLLKSLTQVGAASLTGSIIIPDRLANTVGVGSNINGIFRFLGGGATWTTFIDALKEEGLTKVLAEPKC
jgi:pilus assembly protein CpaC